MKTSDLFLMFFYTSKKKEGEELTVEEIEILVTAKVEDNLKQNMPKIKQMVETIKQQFEKVDMRRWKKKTQQAVEKTSQSFKNIKSTEVFVMKVPKRYSIHYGNII